jgi:phosphoribosyl-AMP cyclohydrolase / phosphoribosyl-ATP pyrophosphohydrolase
MALDFEKFNGLVPAIVQDHLTGRILMLGFMNREAYEITLRDGKATFYSRSRQSLWTKGETSGNYLYVKEILEDCDQDTLLIKAEPAGPVCHTGADTCFNEKNQHPEDFIGHLSKVIRDRRINPSDNSYTSSLFSQGINKIAQKVGEEAVELIIESKDDDKDLFMNEAADLFFHYLVLLEAKGYSFDQIIKILKERHK